MLNEARRRIHDVTLPYAAQYKLLMCRQDNALFLTTVVFFAIDLGLLVCLETRNSQSVSSPALL
jgi:hypothetical protein